MTAAIVVYILIVTAPLIIAAALIEKLCRLWSLPVRSAWAVTALLITLVGVRAVTHQMIAPEAVTAVTAVNLTTSARTTPAANTSFALIALQSVMSMPRAAAAYVSRSVGPAPDRSIAILWFVMTGVMLTLMFVVYSRVRRARHQWSIADLAGHQVRVSPNAGPAVVGIFRPEIVVPRWAMDGHPDDSQLIIMHEMEHRSAHDPLLLAAMWGLVTLFPWHPGAWYCLARTRLAIEIDCDARVVGKGASLRNYAQLLVNQARARLGAPMHMWLGATSLLEPSSHLERRLRAMVTPENESSAKRPYMRMMRSASYIAIASTLAIAACESHVPTAADISGLDATSAQKNVSQLFRADPQLTTYYVNDVAVSAEEAAAISADSIASINIIRSGKPGGKQRISLTTVSDLTRPHTYLATPQPAPLTGYDVQRVADAPASGTAGVAPRLMVPLVKAPGAEPLFLINGVASTTAAYKTLDPAKIVSMEVLKQGSAALAGYTDPRAKNGVISITVKP